MGDTVGEIEQGVKIANDLLPFVFAGLSMFGGPAAAPAAMVGKIILPIFQAIPGALEAIHADTGKPLDQIVQDVVSHLTAGQPNAPALEPSAPPVMTTAGG
jgi:hypothetical protein